MNQGKEEELQQQQQLHLKSESANKQNEIGLNIPRRNIKEVISNQPPSIPKQFKHSILTIDSESKLHNNNYSFLNHDMSLSTTNKPIPSLLGKNIDSLFNQLFFSNNQNPYFHSKLLHFNPKRINQLSNISYKNCSNNSIENANCLQNSLQLSARRLTPRELRNYVLNGKSTSQIDKSKEKQQKPCSRQQRLLSKTNQYTTTSVLNASQSKTTMTNQSHANNTTLPIIHKDPQLSDASKRNSRIIKIGPPKDDISYYTPDFNYYIIHPENCGYIIKNCMTHRINWKVSQTQSTSFFNFQWSDCSNKVNYPLLSSNPLFKQCVNHYKHHSSISDKANMFLYLLNYCEKHNREVFQYIPFTIIINQIDQSFYNTIDSFKKVFSDIQSYLYDYNDIKNKTFSRRNTPYISLFSLTLQKIGLKTSIMIPKAHYNERNIWIVKTPNLNRGRCIKLINSIEQLTKYIKQSISGTLQDYSDENNNKIEGIDYQLKYHSKTIIIQKYIEKPLLYYQRKFDIRIWVLITHKFEVYAFKEGHLKTCSVDYDCNDINSFVHITNYSLQKYNKQFSKYEKGNEVSFDSFQTYLDETYSDKGLSVKGDLFPKFKEIIELTCKSARNKLNSSNRQHCFEIFGYDFMMDATFNIFLIEINTNPGLEESSEIIKAIVPRMIDDALRLTIDELFERKYAEEFIDKNSKEYQSPYDVKGYNRKENLWEFVCDLNKTDAQIFNKSNINKHYKLHHRKKKNIKKKIIDL